ncbi:hypothetical protein CONLIGDRAFT_682217 [Coniochaeta ligniaria NRRL 30616]|uniref:Altered inheritance of mitochondria protein 19 n=1 Tax=Coniochaeta ligniaria NRRL 30616 TaxID=1408157 RepID=A0A1J7J1C9_9PEZI|nr:hypothetical protein CONLIGDRAFT_682217 [Coniochaeta ligniaria NRRL 30616]
MSTDSEPSKSILTRLNGWGTSAFPPMTLATLITALHFRPLQKLPMLFCPLLLFSSYLNVAGFKIDSAGMTAAWSGLYVLLAARRRPVSLKNKLFSARGMVRGAAMGLGTVNAVAGGLAYATADRAKEEEERRERNRWGMYKD